MLDIFHKTYTLPRSNMHFTPLDDGYEVCESEEKSSEDGQGMTYLNMSYSTLAPNPMQSMAISISTICGI